MKQGEVVKCTLRAKRIQPFYVMELLEKAQALEAQGEDIVHMEIGEPDFPTPTMIREAGIQAIAEGRTFYTHSLGLRELRERIARYYEEAKHVSVSPEKIVVTNGTSGAFFLLCSVLLNRRRHMVISDPGYPCYRNFGTLFDARVLSIPVNEATRFEITPQNITDLKVRPDMVMISSPSNPTGLVYGEESLRSLQAAVSRAGGMLVVDEIYSGLTYDKDFPSAVGISPDITIIDGFSKTYAMTGWRLGWMVVPDYLVRPIQRVGQNVFISAPTVAQYAALRAFDAGDDIDAMRQMYRERRAFLFPRLEKLGFGLSAWPDGAFYIYANIGQWAMDSMTFVERALTEAKVALTPGYDFGSYRAGEHVRFSYATSIERLKEGCARLGAWLQTL